MARRAVVVSLVLLGLAAGSLLHGRQTSGQGNALELAPAQAAVETDERMRFFEARVRLDPVDFIAYNHLAEAHLQRARGTGDVAFYGRAEAALRRSIDALPADNFSAYLLFAAVQVSRHRFAEALGWLEPARELQPDEPAVHALAGDALLGLGRYEEAAAAYQRLAESPSVAALARLAHMAEIRGDLDTAWPLLDRALGYRAENAENAAWLRVQRGNLRFLTGRLADAEAEYRQALTLFPGYVHGLAGLARVAAAKGDYDGAAGPYRRVVTRMPLPEYLMALREVLAALGRHNEALDQLKLLRAIDRLYRANGVDTDLQMTLFAADYEPDLGDWIVRARALYARRPTIYAADALGWTLYRAGHPDEALPYAREALRLGTRDPLLLFHAGAIAAGAGQTDEARGYLEAAVTQNPQFSVRYAGEARRLLRSLGNERTVGR